LTYLKLHIATKNWGNFPSKEFKSKDFNNLWASSEPSNKIEEVNSVNKMKGTIPVNKME
jgi:hypothetical protein